MLNEFFNLGKSNTNTNFLAIPSVKNPRLIVAVKNLRSFKTGLQFHNTASVKNKFIKIFLVLSYYISIQFKTKLVSSNSIINGFKKN